MPFRDLASALRSSLRLIIKAPAMTITTKTVAKILIIVISKRKDRVTHFGFSRSFARFSRAAAQPIRSREDS